jgi:hypothetical protein
VGLGSLLKTAWRPLFDFFSLIVTTGTVTSPSEIQVSISLGNILVFLSLRSLSISRDLCNQIRPGPEPKKYRTQEEHASHYTTLAVSFERYFSIKANIKYKTQFCNQINYCMSYITRDKQLFAKV